MSPAPKRRWFRFSLRTMFIVVTVFGCLLGWLSYELNWIRQRQAWRPASRTIRANFPNRPPGLLWLFRERGESWIEIHNGTAAHVAEVQALFPEAIVVAEGQETTEEQTRAYRRMYEDFVTRSRGS